MYQCIACDTQAAYRSPTGREQPPAASAAPAFSDGQIIPVARRLSAFYLYLLLLDLFPLADIWHCLNFPGFSVWEVLCPIFVKEISGQSYYTIPAAKTQ
ncbi:MAG: hypothetical protein IKH57_09985 [Clostridia bacterium]|nr:hypothetical protein [Clostridia bacterium]